MPNITEGVRNLCDLLSSAIRHRRERGYEDRANDLQYVCDELTGLLKPDFTNIKSSGPVFF